jgi:hypothetical protein
MQKSPKRLSQVIALGVWLCSLAPFMWASPAQASTWSAPTTLETPQEVAAAPVVSVDSKGNALASWTIFDDSGGDSFCCYRVQTAFRPAGGSFESPVTVSEPGRSSLGAQIAFDGKGNATAIWRPGPPFFGSAGRIETAFRPAGGSFETPQLMPDLHSTNAQVAVDHEGNAVAVWMTEAASHGLFEWDIRASFRPAGGDFGPPQTLSRPEDPINFDPQVAISRRGDAIVSWHTGRDVDQPCCSEIRLVRRPAGGSFGPPETITEPGHNVEPVRLVMNDRGDALLLWQRRQVPRSCCLQIRASFQPAGGRFGPRETIVQTSDVPDFNLDAGIDRSGEAVVAWKSGDESNVFANVEIQVAIRPPRGTFGPPVTISETCRPEDFDGFLRPQVAVDPKGDAVVVWSLCGPTQATRRPAKGTFGPAETISTPEPFSSTFSPDVAIDDKGNATAAWEQDFTIKAAFQPAR